MAKKGVGGRPTKFNQELLRAVELLAKKGATDQEIAYAFGVTQQTIDNWKKKHPEFFGSVKDWKAKADAKVERSLYERARGYSHKAEKIQIHAETGKVTRVETIEHYPPDPTSMIFWLKNRKAKDWRDKIEHDHNVRQTPAVVEEDGEE